MTATAGVSIEKVASLPLARIFPPILLPIFLAVVDGTIVATALPAMAAAFGDVERVSWVIAAYLVASSVAAPIYGRLGDAWGRRRLLLFALGLFIAASVLCSSAEGILSLTAARVLQGFGGGGLMVLSQALLGENLLRIQLGRAQGFLSAVIVVSSTFGPVAGGVRRQAFGWPSVFLVNLPLGLLAMVLALRLPSRAGSGEGGRFDWAGLVFFTGLVVPLLLALEQIQHLDAAGLPGVVAGFSVSLSCLTLLLRQERRASQPLFPLKMLGHPAMWRANAMAACSGALLVSEATLLPLHLQSLDGASAGRIGLMMLPLTATVGVGSFVTGRLISRTGRVSIYPAVGQFLAALGLLLVAFCSRGADALLGPWGLPGMLAAVALFQGTAMPVAQITAQSLAPPTMLGAAAAAVQLSRSVGSAAGVTIVTSVLFMVLRLDPGAVAAFADALHNGPAALDGLPASVRAAVTVLVEHAFTAAFLAIAVFAAINSALALTSPLRRLEAQALAPPAG